MNNETPIKKIVVVGPESTGKSSLCKQLAEHFNTLWCPEYAREYLLAHGKEYSYDDLLTIATGQLQLEDKYLEKIRNPKPACRQARPEIRNTGKENELGIENWKLRNENSEQETMHRKLVTGNLPAGRQGWQPETGNRQLLFIDTDMYVMKVWCEYVFGMCHEFIVDQIAERKYDLYLLCNTDLPWVPDELREYPEEAPRRELYQIYKNILVNQQTPWVEISGNDYNERLQKAIAAVNEYLL
ncbi:MAG TPA: AAA family ATPase [Chitinophagaceae bacterium]|jgi:nicotinamide riboside kinase